MPPLLLPGCPVVGGWSPYKLAHSPCCRLPETTTRMSNMIEVMAKLKNARNLDVRQSGLVDSAYFAVKVGPGGWVL